MKVLLSMLFIFCGTSLLKKGSNLGYKTILRYFPGSPLAKTLHSQCRGLDSVPGQGTRFHLIQLRPGMAKKIN